MFDDEDQTVESSAGDEKSQVGGSAESKPMEKTLSKSAKKRARRANADTQKTEDTATASTDGKGAKVIEMKTRE
jgi:hypothetical protein